MIRQSQVLRDEAKVEAQMGYLYNLAIEYETVDVRLSNALWSAHNALRTASSEFFRLRLESQAKE